MLLKQPSKVVGYVPLDGHIAYQKRSDQLYIQALKDDVEM